MPITILYNNAVGITWVVCWWLINYFPWGLPRRLHHLLPIRVGQETA